MKGNLAIGSVPRKHCPRSAGETGAAIHVGESGRASRVNVVVLVGLKKLFNRGEPRRKETRWARVSSPREFLE